jgi:hypothetical protein
MVFFGMLVILLMFVAAPILLVGLPILVGAKSKGKHIATSFLVCFFFFAAFTTWWSIEGTKTSCSINESECIGANGFVMLYAAWTALFSIIGSTSAFLNIRKWRKINARIL